MCLIYDASPNLINGVHQDIRIEVDRAGRPHNPKGPIPLH